MADNNTDTLDDYVGEPIPDHARIIFIIVGILYIVSGVMGNIIIAVTVVTNQGMHNPHYYFIINLAIADLVITGYVVTYTVVGLILDYYPVVSFSHCVFNGFVIVCGYVASLSTLMVISVNRYLNICQHEIFTKIFSRKKASSFCYCILIWLLAILSTLPPLLGWGRFHFDTKTHYCGYDRTASFSYTMFLLLGSIGIPVFIVFACNFAIWRFIRQASHRIYDSSAAKQLKRRDLNQSSDVVTPTTSVTSPGSSVLSPTLSGSTEQILHFETTRESSDAGLKNSGASGNVSSTNEQTQNYSETRGLSDSVTAAFKNHLAPPEMGQIFLIPSTSSQDVQGRTLTNYKKATDETKGGNRNCVFVTPDELALIKSLFVVFVSFAVLMTPYMMATLIDTENQWSSLVHLTCSYTSFTNSCINWVVYGFMNKRFRNAYKKLFCFS